MNPTTYSAFGLSLCLPFACPTLPIGAVSSEPDVTVVEDKVPYSLTNAVALGASWEASPGRFLLRAGRRAGRFLVEGGSHVTLQRSPVAEEEMLAFHFLDTVLSAILRQRGLLVLHADAAVTPAGAVAISGRSGAGKSTTLAALLARGCSMLADDVTALRLGRTRQPEVLPGVPQMHLCEDAARSLGCDIAARPRFPWKRMKAAVPTVDSMAGAPEPLRALYLLGTHAGTGLHTYRLNGVERFHALQDCIYGPLLPQDHPSLFPLFSAIAQRLPIVRVERPLIGWTVDEVVESILHG